MWNEDGAGGIVRAPRPAWRPGKVTERDGGPRPALRVLDERVGPGERPGSTIRGSRDPSCPVTAASSPPDYPDGGSSRTGVDDENDALGTRGLRARARRLQR